METVIQDKKQQLLQQLIKNQPTSQQEKNIITAAENAIEQLDFPTTKDEYWKYTRVGKILNNNYAQSPAPDLNKIDVKAFPVIPQCPNTLIFINGYFSEKHSSIEDASYIAPLAKAKTSNPEKFLAHFAKINDYQNYIFSAINTVYHTNGVYIHVPKGISLQPVQIIYINFGTAPCFNPRNLIILEENASADISFIHLSDNQSGGFCNAVTEIHLQENSRLNMHNIQTPSENTHIIHTIDVNQQAHSFFQSFAATFNGNIIRNNINVHQLAQGCETNLYGCFLTDGKTHSDTHTLIEHLHAHNQSNEWYKGVVNGKSTGVFNGKIYIARGAQKINAFQQNNNILLSDDAKIYSKPELEIYADDVKCSHGSTTGQINEEALFYMQARGIRKNKAIKLLIDAFIEDVLKQINNENVQEYIRNIKNNAHHLTA